MKHRSALLPLALALSAFACASHAQNPAPTDIRGCTGIETDSLRLACYDKVTGRVNLPAAQKARDDGRQQRTRCSNGLAECSSTATGVRCRGRAGKSGRGQAAVAAGQPLGAESREQAGHVQHPRLQAGLCDAGVRHQQPEQAARTAPIRSTPSSKPQELDNVETKFQLSLKTKVWQGVFGDARRPVGGLHPGLALAALQQAGSRARSGRPTTNPRPCWSSAPITTCSAGTAACSASAWITNPMAARIRCRAAGTGSPPTSASRAGLDHHVPPMVAHSRVRQRRQQPRHQRLHGPRRSADRARMEGAGIRPAVTRLVPRR